MAEQSRINVIKGRKVSVEGAKLIGTGAVGKVYLLPDDNVVKVLDSTDYAQAEKEILLSKWAFGKGIATAISYDIVDVNGHPGLVYESLGRDNLRNRFRENADNLPPLFEQYLDFIKSVNAITVEQGQLPSAKQQVTDSIMGIKHYFSDKEFAKIMSLMDSVPADNHLIHGDCHMKNIKVVNGQLYLIDLDTLSMGDVIFELVGLCSCYHAYVNDNGAGYNDFFDIDDGIVHEVYHYVLDNYFPNIGEDDKKENVGKIELLTYISMLYKLNPNSAKDKACFDDMLGRVRERLDTAENFILKR